jgi:hypothetical protein
MEGSTGILSFDDSHSHLCVITLAEVLDDGDISRLYERVLRVFKKRKRIVLLVDASNSRLTAQQRKLMVTRMKEHEDEFRHWVACGVLVIESALARGTLTALLWMFRPPYEQKVFQTIESARAWALDRVAEIERQDLAVGRGAER